MGERLVLMWCAATDVRLEWVLAWNRASRWGIASFDVVSCYHRCSSRVGARRIERLDWEWLAATDVRLERLIVLNVWMSTGFHTQGIVSCDGKTQRLLGDSVPKMCSRILSNAMKST